KPGALASGDLDHDGQRDMVILHEGGQGTILLGTAGAWERLSLGGRAGALVVSDVDEDGCDDVLIGRADPPGVTLIRGASCEVPITLPDHFTPRTSAVANPDDANRGAIPTIDPSW